MGNEQHFIGSCINYFGGVDVSSAVGQTRPDYSWGDESNTLIKTCKGFNYSAWFTV